MNSKAMFAISLVIACGLWLYVFVGANREEHITIPVTLEDIPEGMMAAVNPNTATIRISGPHTLVDQAIKYMGIKLNAAGLATGVSTLIVSPEDIDSKGLKILDISPSSFEVTLESAISRNVPVDAFILDTPAPGYKIASVEITPETVTLEGMQKDISLIEKAQTKYISVKNSKNSFTQDVDILNYGHLKSVVPSTVTVKVVIVENIITEQYTLPAECEVNKRSLRQAPQIFMNIRGRADVIDAIGESPMVWLDCSKVTEPGIYMVPVVAVPFPKTEIIDLEPSMVEVEVME